MAYFAGSAGDAHNDVIWTVDRLSGETLGYFGGNGRLAGQLHFPNAIDIDTHGNIFVGEVDTAKRIQKFAPVMAGGGYAGCIRRGFRWPGRVTVAASRRSLP